MSAGHGLSQNTLVQYYSSGRKISALRVRGQKGRFENNNAKYRLNLKFATRNHRCRRRTVWANSVWFSIAVLTVNCRLGLRLRIELFYNSPDFLYNLNLNISSIIQHFHETCPNFDLQVLALVLRWRCTRLRSKHVVQNMFGRARKLMFTEPETSIYFKIS